MGVPQLVIHDDWMRMITGVPLLQNGNHVSVFGGSPILQFARKKLVPDGESGNLMSLPHFSSDFTIKMSHLSRSFTIKHGDLTGFSVGRIARLPSTHNTPGLGHLCHGINPSRSALAWNLSVHDLKVHICFVLVVHMVHT